MGTTKKPRSPPLSLLQKRFLKSGLKDLSDSEILELFFNLNMPGKDYHKLARAITSRFKNLKELLETPAEQIKQVPGLNKRDTFFLSIMQEICRKFEVERILEGPIYEPGRIIFEYLYSDMRGLDGEHFKLVCLDGRKKIIETLDLPLVKQDVSLTQTLRVIIETAIIHKARYFIVVHNHTSGDPQPTQNDKDITLDMVFAGMIIQIKLLDHIIFGDHNFFSFANEGLIEEYEAEFLDLKLIGTSEAKRRLKASRNDAGKP